MTSFFLSFSLGSLKLPLIRNFSVGPNTGFFLTVLCRKLGFSILDLFKKKKKINPQNIDL